MRQEHYDGPDYFPNGGGGGAVGGSGRGGSTAAAAGDLGRETPFVPVASSTERGQRQSDSNQIGVSLGRDHFHERNSQMLMYFSSGQKGPFVLAFGCFEKAAIAVAWRKCPHRAGEACHAKHARDITHSVTIMA